MRFADAPTETIVEATIIRRDGTREELGQVAYAHRSRVKTILGQRAVRGGGSLRALLGRGPKLKENR